MLIPPASGMKNDLKELQIRNISPSRIVPGQAWENQQRTPGTKSSRGNLYSSQLWPVFWTLRLYGRYPIQINREGEYTCRWRSWWMLYCIMLNSILFILTVINSYKRIKLALANVHNYEEFIFNIHAFVYLSHQLQVPFAFWSQLDGPAIYFTQWAQFQEDWSRTFGQSFEMNYGRRIKWSLVAYTIGIASFILFSSYTVLTIDPWWYYIPFFFILSSTVTVLIFWIASCRLILSLNEELRERLSYSLENRPNSWFLFKWRLLWLDLRALTESLGSLFSGVLMSILLTYGGTFLFGLYSSFVNLITYGPNWRALGFFIAGGISLSIVYLFCDTAHLATSDASAKVLSSLLKGKLVHFSNELKYEMSMVLEAVKTQSAQIKVAGFVTLNRPFIVSMTLNVFTYLIVLLQFKVSEE